jgi:hypothetical protein
MKTTSITLALLVCVVLGGCATGEKVSSLHPGMTKEQVIHVLGRPDSYDNGEGYEIFAYNQRMMSGWSWDRADYVFRFKDDALVSYGPQNVSHREVHPVPLQPMQPVPDFSIRVPTPPATLGENPPIRSELPTQYQLEQSAYPTGQIKFAADGTEYYEYRREDNSVFWSNKKPQ